MTMGLGAYEYCGPLPSGQLALNVLDLSQSSIATALQSSCHSGPGLQHAK